MKKYVYTASLVVIVLIAIILRLYRIDGAVADWHSWRQTDTAAVARNFIVFGIDPLHPRFYDLSNIASGKDNPSGWRMVEFPLYQLLGSVGFKLFGTVTIEIWLRLITIAASTGTAVLLALLVSRFTGNLAGILTGFAYAVFPYSIYYGRTILPEPFMVFWSVLSVYLLSTIQASNKKPWLLLVLAGASAALALLVKPTAIFLLLPASYLIWKRFSFSKDLFIGLLGYWVIGLFPLWWWRQWILQYPEGIPVYAWLLNEGNIRFKGAWFYWLFAERLGKLILGYWGLIPFALGILVRPEKKEGWVFHWFLFGSMAYMGLVARGNVQHDYYQIAILPIVAIYMGKGIAFLLSNNVFSKAICYLLSAICYLLMFAFSWYTIRTFYWINRPEIVEAGKMADKLLPLNAKVIAPYNGDTTFLYQTNRQGWPIGFEIDKKIMMGATHYVTVSPTDSDFETKELAEKYAVLVRNDKFAIIDLTKPKSSK